jgi:hypothetical protein
VGADGVLRDEETLGDLVRPQMLVEQEQNLDLSRGEDLRDRVRNAVEPAALAHAIEEAPRDTSRERRIPAGDTAEKGGDLLRGLGLQEVPRGTGSDRREEVLLGVGGREDDDLARGRLLTDSR